MIRRLFLALLLLYSLAVQTQSAARKVAFDRVPLTGGCNASRPLPMDVTTIDWSGAYGVCSLTAKWLSGKLFDIIVDGHTYTIKAIKGFPDVRKLARLLGVSPMLGTAGAPLSKWYDESVHGNDCSSPSGARPSIWLINGKVSVAFDGFLVDEASGSNADSYCALPSGVVTNNQATTVYAAVQMVSGGATYGYTTRYFPTLFSAGDTEAHGFIFNAGPPSEGSAISWTASARINDTTTTPTLWPETQPVVIGMIAGSDAFSVTQNEESASSSALPVDTATGGYIGATPFSINGGFYGRMYTFMVAGATAASSAQQTVMRNALYSLHQIAKRKPKYAILVDGASVDVGLGSRIGNVNGYGWVEQMLAQIPTPIRMGNTAVSGATTAEITSTISKSQCNFFKSGYTNILIGPSAAAGNSIIAGKTGAQAYSDLQTYVTDMRNCANPPSAILVWLLGTSCTECVRYNNLIVANAALLCITPIGGSDHLNPIMAAFATSNAKYFNQSPSWLSGHPTIAGYQNLSRAPLAALQTLASRFSAGAK
jgi:hypothetical protein